MCNNYCNNNILIQSSVPIQTNNEMRDIENKIKFLIDRPSRNFKFNFTLNSVYFIIECSTLEDVQHLQNTKLFHISFDIKDIDKHTRNFSFQTYEVKDETSIHDIKCFKFQRQLKDQVLVFINPMAVKTRAYKKFHQSIFRNQIICEDNHSSTFNNTRTITYNEDFNFEAPKIKLLSQRTKLYKVFETNAIAIKFNDKNYRPDIEDIKYLFEIEGRRHAKFTKLEHEYQLYIIQATSSEYFNELIYDLEAGYIQQSIDISNKVKLLYSQNEDTIFIPNFSYDLIRNWEFFAEYIKDKLQ